MTPELQNKLFEKYSKIFKQKDMSITESCMGWGIDCGDGWYWLIDQLCQSLQSDVDSRNLTAKKLIPQIEAVQVKEKFGGLRFYTQSANDEQYGMIDLAETMSYSICENCGSVEDVSQTKGWIKTLCEKCMKLI